MSGLRLSNQLPIEGQRCVPVRVRWRSHDASGRIRQKVEHFAVTLIQDPSGSQVPPLYGAGTELGQGPHKLSARNRMTYQQNGQQQTRACSFEQDKLTQPHRSNLLHAARWSLSIHRVHEDFMPIEELLGIPSASSILTTKWVRFELARPSKSAAFPVPARSADPTLKAYWGCWSQLSTLPCPASTRAFKVAGPRPDIRIDPWRRS
ncbi:hypothetical protein SAMN04487917_11367 [Arthrobacter sp. yr096]|nr:hypothetical protein SAMN04487917_11367 [Arthrobacter sp. yr096]